MTESVSVSPLYPSSLQAALVSVTLSGILVPLNSSMIAVALPEIMRDFHIEVSAAGWLVTAYLITMVALQLVAGKLGDHMGRRKVLLGSLLYFGLASLVAVYSPNLMILLFARIQQAISGAFLATNGLALGFEIVPAERRGRDLGLLNAAFVLAAAGGPLLAGLLIKLMDWRAIFWVNIPLVLIALLLGWSTFPANRLMQGNNSIDLSEIWQLLRDRTFLCANGTLMLMNLAMYMTMLTIPILLSNQVGWTSLQTGVVLSAMSVTLAFFSPIGGRLSDRRGKRLPNLAGLMALTIGLSSSTILGEAITLPILLSCLGLVGAGIGLCSISLQTAALEFARPEQTGMASGISSTSRYLGSIIGSGILTGFLGATQAGNFKLIFLIATIAAMCAVIVSLGVQNRLPENVSRIEKGELL